MRRWHCSGISIIIIFIVLMFATVGEAALWGVKKIRMPKSATELKGEHYRDVITLLETAGFTNIKTAILDDLVAGWLAKDGEVERVSVNG